MSRRPNWLSAAAIGGAIALLAVSAGPVFAQDAAEMPPAGGYTSYPNYGEGVDCEDMTYTTVDADSGEESEATAKGSFNGQPYSGNLKSIEATGDYELVFTMCDPDPPFLQKIAFSSFGIQDADYLIANAATGDLLDHPNGTGPYKLAEWREGEEIIFEANPDYWGEAPITPNVVVRWSDDPTQKLLELQSGSVDGIDNPGIDDYQAIIDDPALELIDRESLNVFYLGMNDMFPPFGNEKIRQAIAMGIDRQRQVDNFFSDTAIVPTHFTPCAIPFGCEGEDWYEFDPEAARALLAEGLAEEGLDAFPVVPLSLRDVARPYLPLPVDTAVDLQDQLRENLGIETTIDVQESVTFLDNAYLPNLPGFHLLGWGADYPDATNFLDFHFGAGAGPQFGNGHPDIWEALQRGATSLADEDRRQAYEDANNAIKLHVPMVPIAINGSATAWTAGLPGAHSSPLTNEQFRVIDAGDDQLVFMQNGQPGSFFCADETDGEALRMCEQTNESLYAYEVAGTEAIPALAEECTSNEDATVWTCKIREGVKFHDGSDLTAQDVVTTYAASWDTSNPLHVGRVGDYYYFSSLWGDFLTPGSDGA